MLLAKLLYSQARIDEAMKLLNTTKLHKTLSEHIKHLKQQHDKQSGLRKLYSPRELQIYAEAHCVRGLCVEARRLSHRQSVSSPTAVDSIDQKRMSEAGIGSEHDMLVLDSFEVASKFAVEHSLMVNQRISPAIQNSPSGPGGQIGAGGAGGSGVTGTGTAAGTMTLGPNSGAQAMSQGGSGTLDLQAVTVDDSMMDLINPLYEIALQKAPILYIKRGYFKLRLFFSE